MFSLIVFDNGESLVVNSKTLSQCAEEECVVKYRGGSYKAKIIARNDNKQRLIDFKQRRDNDNGTLWRMENFSKQTLSELRDSLENTSPEIAKALFKQRHMANSNENTPEIHCNSRIYLSQSTVRFWIEFHRKIMKLMWW
ncbi:uncharacterized protein [Musca autumnalis]|uniref:uncharacterized protein n=1 Tax=Musca autumnalis TaxID=221902 RepID=UPI003CEB0836